ncbi:hypothetical protein GLOIN_2v1478935 [Rhizophagus irregularis DAOM 181602=DAOM 197198]|uniref:Uncharacterized protein n=1 Tax=Rhizophagus irregularis (strain DAOM 181602 / DAOM 197198 / MUCL 43194) TaxID=747089 RepID=A0A2P4PZU1_RHIID|nr:hypothetical protein GLOIN_2v1478935 [Rhizophagus irregularis DAOM 181602=DAOM 197198]PKY15545.1 hypothetical protein RhiirB3_381022 [Rhizophagus irregularis]POG70890.1 hypothetical protein GLOIN_2v1478935 [Rhizophagus irregularis DAOM 181602=DAOM 197198]|eukprot:XP_025177756.1 hypothetical protein GLOIN_2v1478935 [Rhizophagus irregularis DAOM 181602=DAOM 197198]
MTHHQPVIDHDVEADNLLRVGEGTCVWEIDSGSRTGVGFITCSLFFLRSFLLANILAAIYSELEMFVGGPAIGLKVAMNIGKLESVFLVMFVISQLALNPAFVTQYINRLGDRAIGYLLGAHSNTSVLGA